MNFFGDKFGHIQEKIKSRKGPAQAWGIRETSEAGRIEAKKGKDGMGQVKREGGKETGRRIKQI